MKDSWEVTVKWRQGNGDEKEPGAAERPATRAEGTACSVTTFNVPKSKSACKTVGNKIGQSFGMDIDFGGTCGNCEYRQYIKGYFDVNGIRLTHMLPGAANPPTYQPGRAMSATTYLEDGLSPYPGFGPHYGHRNEIGAADDVYQSPNRATGCQYRGTDFPGISGLRSGDTYDIHLDFKGEAINTAEGTTLRSTTWTVYCSGKVA